jgi:O-antigen/teichoic acid export membrane protein
MSSIKQLLGQTGIYGLGTILPRFLNYLLTPLYTYLFTNPADYGINAEIYAYISFLNVIFTYGMETTFFHFSSKYGDVQKIFNITYSLIISTSIVFSFILLMMSDSLRMLLHYQHSIYIYWAVGIIASDALLSIPFAYLRQQQKSIHFSLLKILNVMINIGFNLFFFLPPNLGSKK